MSWFVYILEGVDHSLYTGITNDIERRLREHNGQVKGGAKHTRAHRPYLLAYQEKYPTRSDAAKREYAIKQLTHTEKKRLILNAKKPVS